jgi:hypothetical protein
MANAVETWLKVLGALGAVVAFFWGIYTYKETARLQLAHDAAEADKLSYTRRIEARRPYLEKQLLLYSEATKMAAILGTSNNQAELDKAKERFLELYYGELAMVEHGPVIQAMVAFKGGLDRGDRSSLGSLALDLAHACRDELAASWETDAWKR